MKIDQEPTSAFVIGAVARATGIPVETLRVWERRYEVVTPHRDPNNKRYYTAEDIERLKRLKQLVDLGHSIGSIARLSDGQLREHLGVHPAGSAGTEQGGLARVMVCGEMLPGTLRAWDLTDAGLALEGAYGDPGEFERAAIDRRPDVLVLELPYLVPEKLERMTDLVARTAARRGVIIFGYGPSAMVERGQRLGLWMQRGPIDRQSFAEICTLRGFASAERPLATIPPPRFDGETLAKIAAMAESIRCECPQHLADLVFRVRAFERYSADCQNRNEQDAAVHASLKVFAGRARAIFEEALAFVVEAEGLDLETLRESAGSKQRITPEQGY